MPREAGGEQGYGQIVIASLGVLRGEVGRVGRPRCPTYPRSPIGICGQSPRAAQHLYLERLGLAVPSPLKSSGAKTAGNGWPEGAGRDLLLSQASSLLFPLRSNPIILL